MNIIYIYNTQHLSQKLKIISHTVGILLEFLICIEGPLIIQLTINESRGYESLTASGNLMNKKTRERARALVCYLSSSIK